MDICTLPAESGMCLAYFPSYYYNSSIGECQFFVYGGCGGNANRFKTIDECIARCGTKRISKPFKCFKINH